MTIKEDIVREIRTAKTYPGAIDDLLPKLRELYETENWGEMVKLLNTRKHQTGREYRILNCRDGKELDWSNV